MIAQSGEIIFPGYFEPSNGVGWGCMDGGEKGCQG